MSKSAAQLLYGPVLVSDFISSEKKIKVHLLPKFKKSLTTSTELQNIEIYARNLSSFA